MSARGASADMWEMRSSQQATCRVDAVAHEKWHGPFGVVECEWGLGRLGELNLTSMSRCISIVSFSAVYAVELGMKYVERSTFMFFSSHVFIIANTLAHM